MPDIVSAEVRSRMMAGIRGKDTTPELVLRRGLHALGFRYRLHVSDLPGKPDIVFPGLKAVVFVHGCFWHGHDCHLFRWPSSREEFWVEKINRNRVVDARNDNALASAGWRQGIVWECALKGRTRQPTGEVIETCAKWLRSDEPRLEIRGGE
jgi:DNA mismatch endonuclease, patch repair protein